MDHIDDEDQIEYEEKNNNGLLICDKYIPEEIISQILIYFVDYKSLVNCQIVSQDWKNLIHNYIWRRKSELIVGKSLNLIEEVSWKVYYQICHKKPINKNIIKNHSGQEQLANWRISRWFNCRGDEWIVEEPPSGVPELPKEAQFDDKQRCFSTSFNMSSKLQLINLISEGFSPAYLDKFQPPIKFGEWYICKRNSPTLYKCHVTLINRDGKFMANFNFENTLIVEEQNTWRYVSFEFKNYGPGLRKIFFQHGGRDKFGLNGSKMAGASITINVHYDHLLSSMTN